MCDKGAVAAQVLDKEFQLLQHFPLRERIKHAALRFLHMVEYFVRRYTDLAKEKLGAGILDTQLAYSIRFYCMGSVGMTREWVLNDNITSAETVVQMMFYSMPENLRKTLF